MSRKFKDQLAGNDRPVKTAFTIVELLVVIVILAIAAALAIPTISSSATTQLKSASNMLAGDLEYAKSISISSGRNHTVAFNESAESYSIQDEGGDTIEHPVKKGFDYVVSFSSDSRVGSVEIYDADFDGTNSIKFDYLGSPYDGSGGALNSGSVVLRSGSSSLTVNVEPVTGYISITE